MSIHAAVAHLADAYNKSHPWVERTRRVWEGEQAIVDTPPDEIMAAARDYARQVERAPVLASWLTWLSQWRISFGKRAEPKGCVDCGGSGWREICHRYRTADGEKVRTMAAACGCDLGEHIGNGPAPFWEDVVMSLEQNQHTISVLWTDRNRSSFTLEETMTKTQWEQHQRNRSKVPRTRFRPAQPFSLIDGGGE